MWLYREHGQTRVTPQELARRVDLLSHDPPRRLVMRRMRHQCSGWLWADAGRDCELAPPAVTDGVVLWAAERRKHDAYPKLGAGGPQKLVVLGSEVGGQSPYAAGECEGQEGTSQQQRKHRSSSHAGGAQVDGDHALACPRGGLLARCAGLDWPSARTPADRCRLDPVIYGVTPLGRVLCWGATLVSLLTRTGLPQPPTQKRACRNASGAMCPDPHQVAHKLECARLHVRELVGNEVRIGVCRRYHDRTYIRRFRTYPSCGGIGLELPAKWLAEMATRVLETTALEATPDFPPMPTAATKAAKMATIFWTASRPQALPV